MRTVPTLIDEPGDVAPLPLWLVGERTVGPLLERLGAPAGRWAQAQHFEGERARVLLLPGVDGAPSGALLGLGAAAPTELCWSDAAAWAERLPGATWALAPDQPALGAAATQLAFGWLLGGYRYTARGGAARASAGKIARPVLVAPAGADLRYARAAAEAIAWARDLINTPANLLGPAELAGAAETLLGVRAGTCKVTDGEALRREFPLVAAVGAGSARAPLLIDCHWARPGSPRVRLVGKGVCFDSGGLDLKPSAGMLLMKKDMAGAACALALARMLLVLDAPIDLRLMIPAVENSVGSRAYRPGDVWPSRKGLSVEIGNTDAEGRLVLADALAALDEDKPELLVDLATLTGAARTALGPDLPAAFASDERLGEQLARLGRAQADPLWTMPLWSGYDEELSSRIADLNNVSQAPFAGAIIGALFLRRFVSAPQWIHLDLYGWNPKERAGRPQGADAQCVRALYQLIRERFG